MIKTVADLLQAIIPEKVSKIDATGIVHRPTIGNMYEGLTKDLLNMAVFSHLNLSVVTSSFIRSPKNGISNEMDVMIIEGNGEALPNTSQFIVDEDKVIIVIQVKKTLNKSLLSDAYQNLKNVYDTVEMLATPKYSYYIVKDAIRGMLKRDFPKEKHISTTFSSRLEEQVYNIICVEAQIPPRILLSFGGIKTEYGLRNSFLNVLKGNRLVAGFGPAQFPNLIICGNHSLVKSNGMPYNGLIADNQWYVYNSSSKKPMLQLLEIIWSRLAYRYNLDPWIFGEDLEVEGLNQFLKCNPVIADGRMGWNYEFRKASEKYFKQDFTDKEWQPVTLSTEQHMVLLNLCTSHEILLTKVEEILVKMNSNKSAEELIESLVATNLVYIENNNNLRFLTDHYRSFHIGNGVFVGADDKTGKLTRWLKKQNYPV